MQSVAFVAVPKIELLRRLQFRCALVVLLALSVSRQMHRFHFHHFLALSFLSGKGGHGNLDIKESPSASSAFTVTSCLRDVERLLFCSWKSSCHVPHLRTQRAKDGDVIQ